jgi:hypothetical protein
MVESAPLRRNQLRRGARSSTDSAPAQTLACRSDAGVRCEPPFCRVASNPFRRWSAAVWFMRALLSGWPSGDIRSLGTGVWTRAASRWEGADRGSVSGRSRGSTQWASRAGKAGSPGRFLHPADFLAWVAGRA